MQIIKDKDLIWDTDNYEVILVGTSIYNMLTQGFQSKMVVKYGDELNAANNSTPYADRRKLGKRITVPGAPTISLLYICGYPHSKRDFLDYKALENCLGTANMEFKNKRVAAPFLGTSPFDGNGDRDKCLEIIEANTKDMDFTLYDFQQYNRRKEIAMVLGQWNELKKQRQWDKYNELVRHKDEIIKQLYLKH